MSHTGKHNAADERLAYVRADAIAIDAARHQQSPGARTADSVYATNADWVHADDQTPTAQRTDLDAIFRQLIEDEIKSGRLSKSRRKRIVRYAAQLRLSAVEAGQLIEACRRKVLESKDPTQRAHALRLVPPTPSLVPHVTLMWVVIVMALMLDALVVGWIR